MSSQPANRPDARLPERKAGPDPIGIGLALVTAALWGWWGASDQHGGMLMNIAIVLSLVTGFWWAFGRRMVARR